MSKFKIGDEVVVVKDLITPIRDYTYKVEYTFTIGKVLGKHPAYGTEYASENDNRHCTYDEFLELSPTHNSPLSLALK